MFMRVTEQVGLVAAAFLGVILGQIFGHLYIFKAQFWAILSGTSLVSALSYSMLSRVDLKYLKNQSNGYNFFTWAGLVVVPGIMIISFNGCDGGTMLCGILNLFAGILWLFVATGLFIFSSYMNEHHFEYLKKISFFLALLGIIGVYSVALYKASYLSFLCESPMCASFDKKTFFENYAEYGYDGSRNPTPDKLEMGPADGYYTLSINTYLNEATENSVVKDVAVQRGNPGLCRFYGMDYDETQVPNCVAPVFREADDKLIETIMSSPTVEQCSEIATARQLARNASDGVKPIRPLDDARRIKEFYAKSREYRPLVDVDYWSRFDAHDPGRPDLNTPSEILIETRKGLIRDDNVTVRYNCMEAANASITSIENMPNYIPDAGIGYAPSEPKIGENVTFYSGSSSDIDGAIESFTWYINDEKIGEGSTVTYTFDTAKTHNVTLQATDDDGATGRSKADVEVLKN
jgi:hypothetical protein